MYFVFRYRNIIYYTYDKYNENFNIPIQGDLGLTGNQKISIKDSKLLKRKFLNKCMSRKTLLIKYSIIVDSIWSEG